MTEQQRRQFEDGYWFELGRQHARQVSRRRRRSRQGFWSLTVILPLATVLAVGWLGYSLFSPASQEQRVETAIRSNLEQSRAVGYFYR